MTGSLNGNIDIRIRKLNLAELIVLVQISRNLKAKAVEKQSLPNKRSLY